MSLAARLKSLRLRKSQSLQEVADAVGASKAHIWDLESGRATNPTIELVTKLAKHFKVAVADIVGENPDSTSERSEDVALYRELKTLSDDDKETIRVLMNRLKQRSLGP